MKKLIRKILKEQLTPIRWVKPDFHKEEDEFELVASNLGNGWPDLSWEEVLNNMKVTYMSSKIESLSDEEWSQMDNTDSWEIETLKDVYREIGFYGRSKERIKKFSIEPLMNGGIVETPILIYYGDYPPYLVSGNTRLSVCRVLGIPPMVTKMYF